MEFSKVIASRRAIRKYKPDPVPEEKLQVLYRALQAAPTANNNQPFKFYFVKDAEKRRRIAERACHQEFLLEPPILMVASCEKGYSFDVAIAVDHMVLAATDLGLGTCWVGWFERDEVRKILGIPDDKDIPILIPIGYADETPPAKERKEISELVAEI